MQKQNNSQFCNTSRTTTTNKHPSYQSQSQIYKPSIKIGYNIIQPQNINPNKKRQIIPIYNHQEKIQGKGKAGDGSTQTSGKFQGSQYIKNSHRGEIIEKMQKKGVTECRNKYQNSESIKQNITSLNQNKNSRRSYSTTSVNTSQVTNNLPSYKSTGIKDIMQYHHAGNYRDTRVTEKCTKSSAISRFFKFEDLHEFDFRKRPEFLR